MKTSTLAVIGVIVAVICIQDIFAQTPRGKNKCKFNGIKYAMDTTVHTFTPACKELKCVYDASSEKAVLEFHTIEHCSCSDSSAGKSNVKYGKKPKCKFNSKKIKKNKKAYEDTDYCFSLVCKGKKKSRFVANYASDCTCKSDEHDEYHWSYHGDSGPSSWADHFEFCGLHSQSPIDIVTSSAITDYSLKGIIPIPIPIPVEKPITGGDTHGIADFTLENYNAAPSSMTLLNNGHAAQVSIEAATMPSVKDGGLPGDYEFLQYHFHWGSKSSQGSEHTIDGHKFPMEVHLVHWNKAYGDVGTALGKSDGLAVLGAMFEVASSDNVPYASVINQLSNVHEAGSTSPVHNPLGLRSYLPDDISAFYRYQGSLTTPTCNEAVVWTVFKDTIKISEYQLSKFRELLEEDGTHHIVDNFRPVQPLNGRQVYVKH